MIASAAFALGAVAGCEVPEPEDDTGGLGGGDVGAGECDRGISVVSSDNQSTSVAFLGWDGRVLSPRVLTSGSADAALSTALSGDVVAPTVATSLTETVVIDRYPASVLTWIDLATGAPRGQLSVRTGFHANPQDYVQIGDDLGFVSRYEANPEPGREAFDGGSDVLVIDPRTPPAIVGRIALDQALNGDDRGLVPTPSRMVLAGGKLVVLLSVLSTDFQSAGDSRIVVIEPSTRVVEEIVAIDGLQNCMSLAVSPTGDRVAVGCTGLLQLDGQTDIDRAGVAIVALAAGGAPSQVTGRFAATTFGRSPQFSIAFASDDVVLFPTYGATSDDGGTAHGDDLVALDLASGASRVLMTTAEAFKLGEVRCAASCGTCFVTDVEAVAVRRFTTGAEGSDGSLTEAGLVQIDDGLHGGTDADRGNDWGPRYLGTL